MYEKGGGVERKREMTLIKSKYSTSSNIPWLPPVQTDYIYTNQLKVVAQTGSCSSSQQHRMLCLAHTQARSHSCYDTGS